MTKWEYRTVFNVMVPRKEGVQSDSLLDDVLADLGQQGWELVSLIVPQGPSYYFADPATAVFKRPEETQ